MPHSKDNTRKGLRFLPLILFPLFFSACLPMPSKGLVLPPTPSILDDPGWLLVREAYSTIKEKPGIDSRDAGHLRDGLVLEIKGRAFAAGKGGEPSILWYLVESADGSGWISSADCDVFGSKEQALRSLKRGPAE